MPNFNKIVTLLYEKERLLKRNIKEIAMIATVKRFQKEQEEKKKENINLNLGRRERNIGQGRDKSNNNNNNIDLRPLKHLSSINYKGDDNVPKYSKYLLLPSEKKRKYWLFDYQALYENRAPKQYRNNLLNILKPKANRVTKRSDDFVDNNEIYISAITYMVNCNYDVGDVGDNEYWGFLVIYTTLNINKKVINVESEIKTLYQSLA